MTGKINDIIGEKGYLLRFGKEAVIETIEKEIVKQPATDLCSNQEEADTKMFLAAKFFSSRCLNGVSIQTVDSDFAIFALLYAPILSRPLYIKIGAGKNKKIKNVIKAPFEKNFMIALIGLHAFWGCDPTSVFHRIGKRK